MEKIPRPSEIEASAELTRKQYAQRNKQGSIAEPTDTQTIQEGPSGLPKQKEGNLGLMLFLICLASGGVYVTTLFIGLKWTIIIFSIIIGGSVLSEHITAKDKKAKREIWNQISTVLSNVKNENFEQNAEYGRLINNNSCNWYYIKDATKFGFVSVTESKKSLRYKYIFQYSDISYLAIDVDGNREIPNTTAKNKGSIIGAVGGAVAFGPAGAIVGHNIKRTETGTINTKITHNVIIFVGLKDGTNINVNLTDVEDEIAKIRECYNLIASKHALAKSPQEKHAVEAQDDTKVCPFCAETIKNAAIVCRYCGKDLPDNAVAE